MPTIDLLRRRVTLASLALPLLPALQGCSTPLPGLTEASTRRDAHDLLAESAEAHGRAAFSAFKDINVSYQGKWRRLVGKLQPALVDAGYRGRSEERLLLSAGLVAQAFSGSSGRKHVVRHSVAGAQGEVRVWFNGAETRDRDSRAAAALVADGYSLFLLGPMLLAQYWAADRSLLMEVRGNETVTLDHESHECRVLRIRAQPGLGLCALDELALYIDRRDGLMRRVRFTLNGLESTRGAIAEVDTFDHVTLQGVRWPTRFYERLLRPLPLPVHNWHLTGLDLDRGLSADYLAGSEFAAKAAAPAALLRPRG
jgi:hypothetical protein